MRIFNGLFAGSAPSHSERQFRTVHKLLDKEWAGSLEVLQKTLAQFLHQQFASARMPGIVPG